MSSLVLAGVVIAAGLVFGAVGMFIGYMYATSYIKAHRQPDFPDLEATHTCIESTPLSNISVKEKDTNYLHKRTLRTIPEITDPVEYMNIETGSPSIL